MIDTLLHNLKKAEKSDALKKFSLKSKGYVLVTLHRPSNVDSQLSLKRIMSALKEVQKDTKVVFPVHPRTQKNLSKLIAQNELGAIKDFTLIDPLGYFDFLHLMRNAKFVMTDSGGIQEETTVLGIPCLTIRENTERPITIQEGTNILVGTHTQKIIRESRKILNGQGKKGKKPKYWDGRAANRIIEIVKILHKEKRLARS